MSGGALIGFSSYRFSGFLCLFANGLGGFFGFLSHRFDRVLCLLAYCFDSLLNFVPCFLRSLFYVFSCSVLPNRRQRAGCDESDNQTRYSHDFLPLIKLLVQKNGFADAVARISG